MTITSVAPVVDATGITAPPYADVLAFVQGQYAAIFGADAYVAPDSQDGQFQALMALAISDVNATSIDIYRSFSPSTAASDALSSNVKINGIQRNEATFSTVDVQVIGQVGTTITNGSAQSSVDGSLWNLPSTVTIPGAGFITVTATCQALGAITAAPGDIEIIATPTRGWQSVNNVSAAAPGNAIETDAQLRERQTVSVGLPALTPLEAIVATVANVPGVTRYNGYENPTSSTDTRGINPYTVVIVAEGGDAQAIAQAIADKKAPGIPTQGLVSQTVFNAYGIPTTIYFFRPQLIAVTGTLTIHPLAGYTSAIGAAAAQVVVDYINSVPIGGGIAKAIEWGVAIQKVMEIPGSNTFALRTLTLGAGQFDFSLAFDMVGTASPGDIVLVTV